MSNLPMSTLIHNVAVETGVTKKATEKVAKTLLDKIKKALCEGHSITLTGVGTLTPYKQATRNKYDLKSECVKVCEGKIGVKLSLSKALRHDLNKD